MTLCNTGSSSRSNHSVVFLKIAVLKNFEMFTVNYLCWSLLFNDAAGFLLKILLKWYFATEVSFYFRYTAYGFLEMIKSSYSPENLQAASSESLQCIMQVLKRTSKKRWSFKFIFLLTIRKIYSSTWKKSLFDIRHF